MGRWTCHLCGAAGTGGLPEFYRHYNLFHK